MSQSAVSRAFTPGAAVAERTRDRVYQAARELGYIPNGKSARSLFTPIAVVVGDIANPFYPEVLEAFSLQLQGKGYCMELYCLAPGETLEALLPKLARSRVAGVVITSATLASGAIAALRALSVPVVLFNRTLPLVDVSSVSCDNYAAGLMVAEHFLDRGHRRIGFVAGRTDTSTSRERQRGFADGLARAGETIWHVYEGEFDYATAYAAAKAMLKEMQRPDALFCANDIMAIAVIDALREGGAVRIPGDIAIVGCDDIRMAAWPAYALSTVRQRVDVMVEETITLIGRLLSSPESAGINRFVTAPLILRGTTR